MERLKPNQIRHQDNLRHLHGQFYHGVYFHHGVEQINKKKGVVYEREPQMDTKSPR